MDKLLCSAAVVSSFCFFLAYSQSSQIFYWMSTILPLHAWCGLSANLECRSEMCCTRLSEIQDAYLSSYIFATKACIDNRKNVVQQQYFLHMSSQYGELRLISSWDRLESLGHPSKFQPISRHGLGFVVFAIWSTAFNRGRHVHSAGRPSRWASTHIPFLFNS